MTVLVAYWTGDGVVIGSDSRAVYRGQIESDCIKKWSRAGRWVLGVSGVGEIRPEIDAIAAEHGDPYELCAALRRRFRDLGWEPDKPDDKYRPPAWDLNLLFTDGAEIWSSWGTLFPFNIADEGKIFETSGSGALEAYASLVTSAAFNVGDVRRRVQVAIETAIQLCAGCGGEIVVDFVPKP